MKDKLRILANILIDLCIFYYLIVTLLAVSYNLVMYFCIFNLVAFIGGLLTMHIMFVLWRDKQEIKNE